VVDCVYDRIATYRKDNRKCTYKEKGTDPLAKFGPNFTAAKWEFPGEKGQRGGKAYVP